jgi:hypothetical protein
MKVLPCTIHGIQVPNCCCILNYRGAISYLDPFSLLLNGFLRDVLALANPGTLKMLSKMYKYGSENHLGFTHQIECEDLKNT